MASELEYPYVQIPTPLVELAVMKVHLRETGTEKDAEITRKTLEAQSHVLQYLKKGADPTWTYATVPLHVAAAIEKLTVHLWEDRGDGLGITRLKYDIWTEIAELLAMHRDPGLA